MDVLEAGILKNVVVEVFYPIKAGFNPSPPAATLRCRCEVSFLHLA